jgi:hypothetical protein
MRHRRGRALRRRYGHAKSGKVVRRGMLSATIAYQRDADRYRVDFAWPEISSDGRISRSVDHHLIKSIPAAAVLVQFTDVRNPKAPRVMDEALRMIIAQNPDVQHIEGWLAKHGGAGS